MGMSVPPPTTDCPRCGETIALVMLLNGRIYRMSYPGEYRRVVQCSGDPGRELWVHVWRNHSETCGRTA